MTERRSIRDFDWPLLAIALAIAALGLMEIYSATRNSVWQEAHLRQILWIACGLGLLWLISAIDYHWLVDQSPLFYGLTLAGLVATLAFAPAINGAKRWLPIPGLGALQVSELVKVVLVLLTARLAVEWSREEANPSNLSKLAGLFAPPIALVLLQPNLSTSLSYLPIFGMGVFLVGVRWRYVVGAAALALALAPLAYYSLTPYQRERLTVFVNPEEDPRGGGYQPLQSKIAVGSGGIWGKGLAQGSQTQLRFLPEAHTDFIFASYAEETGFVGVLIALGLYLALLMRIVNNAHTAPDIAGMQICMCVGAVLLFHIVVNVGMVVGRMPVTGIPLPLMSYGGSNILTTFALLGLVNNVRLRRFTN